MVAVAWLVAKSVVGTAGTVSPVERIFLKQKQGRMDIDGLYFLFERWRYQHVVQAPPKALVAVCTLGSMQSAGVSADVSQLVLTYAL